MNGKDGKNGNDGKNGRDARDGRDAKDGKDQPGLVRKDVRSHTSHSSHTSQHPGRVIPPRGDYKTLLSFQKAEVVYDLTFRFAHKFLLKGDRTIDQMIQAARSGKKNILEGSKAGRSSKEMEIKLTVVARGSLEELLDDYQDFLRVRELRIWSRESKKALYIRRFGRQSPQTFELYRAFVETRSSEVVANIAICLIHQANYLIDQQLLRLDRDFVENGGLKERMARVRLEHRAKRTAYGDERLR